MRRSTRVVTVAVAIVGTVAMLAGCGSGKPSASRKPGSTGGAQSSATATSTSDGASAGAGAGTGAAGGGAATGGAAGGPTGSPAPSVASGTCPVTAATLMAALRANAKLYSALAQPNEVRNPQCARGYAVATTVPVAQVEPAQVLYSFDAKAGTWRAVNAGTDDICDSYVPADIAKQLPGC